MIYSCSSLKGENCTILLLMVQIPNLFIFTKRKIAVSRITPNTEGASFHLVPPLPANRKLSWVKDAIWRLIEELFNPTILMTTSPPGLSSKLLYLLPTFAHQPQLKSFFFFSVNDFNWVRYKIYFICGIPAIEKSWVWNIRQLKKTTPQQEVTRPSETPNR